MITGQIRISILNTPGDMSPLKFKGWLRTEVSNIQGLAKGENDMIIVRLLLPKRLGFAITQKQLDVILQGLVDKHPNIFRIELRPIERTLSTDELAREAEDANEHIKEILAAMKAADEPVEEGEKPPTLH